MLFSCILFPQAYVVSLSLYIHISAFFYSRAVHPSIGAGYAFNDHDELPAWFVEDEKRHNVAQLPVTRAEVDYFKEQLKAINARPMKKLAEARARKREKATKAWEGLKNKAQLVVDNPDLGASEKLRAVQKLYAGKKGIKEKKDKHYVLATKSGRTFSGERKQGTRVKMVDRRMKKEIRREKDKAKKGKGSKGGKGKKSGGGKGKKSGK